MPLITRQDKGTRLSLQEMDSNLTYLEDLALTNNNYLVYTALITQSGTGSIPTAIVLQNTIGEITWSYVSPAVYVMSSDAAFVAGKTYLNNQVLHLNQESGPYIALLQREDENTISLSTNFIMGGDPVDSILVNHSLEVRVYL